MARTTYIHGRMRDADVCIDLSDKLDKSSVSVLYVHVVDILAKDGFDGKVMEDSFFGDGKTESGVSVKRRIVQSDGLAAYTIVCYVWGLYESGILTRVYGRIIDVPGRRDVVTGVNFVEVWDRIKARIAMKKL